MKRKIHCQNKQKRFDFLHRYYIIISFRVPDGAAQRCRRFLIEAGRFILLQQPFGCIHYAARQPLTAAYRRLSVKACFHPTAAQIGDGHLIRSVHEAEAIGPFLL